MSLVVEKEDIILDWKDGFVNRSWKPYQPIQISQDLMFWSNGAILDFVPGSHPEITSHFPSLLSSSTIGYTHQW